MDSKKGIFVSESALNDYIKCSQKLYYRIFEPQEAIPNREMVMGEITHKVLEKAWQNIDVALGLADSLCKKEAVDEVGRNSVHHFIHTYFERFSFLVTKEDKVENRFKVKLHDDVYLVGKFDRISKGTIIDWKTDSNPPKKLDNSVQFILYNMAYKLIYDKPAEGLYLASLKDGSLVRYNESQEHTNALVNYIIPEFIQTIKNKSFVKTGLFTGACYRCPYKIPCLGDKGGMVRSEFIEE